MNVNFYYTFLVNLEHIQIDHNINNSIYHINLKFIWSDNNLIRSAIACTFSLLS